MLRRYWLSLATAALLAIAAALLPTVWFLTTQAGAPSKFTVNSTGDALDAAAGNGVCATAAGVCTLRAAIQESNALAGTDVINFNIPTTDPGFNSVTGAFTITPATPGLPAIAGPVTIDGTTQPGFTCCPIIELNGTSAGGGAHGLAIFTGSTTIRWLVINRFGGNGILMQGSPATGNVIGANYIGLDVTGTTDLGNGLNGVAISGGAFQNTVGGDTQSAINRISGNNQNGVIISGSGSRDNKVQSNFIGTDVQGTSDLGNTLDGVRIDNAPSNTV